MKNRITYRSLIDMMDELEDIDLIDPDEWEVDFQDYSINGKANMPRRWSVYWVGSALLLNFILGATILGVILAFWR